MLHSDWRFGPHFRAFVQLKSGLESSRAGGPRPIDEKKLDFEAAFFETRTPRRQAGAELRIGQTHLRPRGAECPAKLRRLQSHEHDRLVECRRLRRSSGLG